MYSPRDQITLNDESFNLKAIENILKNNQLDDLDIENAEHMIELLMAIYRSYATEYPYNDLEKVVRGYFDSLGASKLYHVYFALLMAIEDIGTHQKVMFKD